MAPAMFLTLMLAQGLPAEAGEAGQLARIRRALAEAPASVVPPVASGEGPVFKVTVFGRKPLKPLWHDYWSVVPSNVRPWFRGYHHEFLEQVTPEEFRSATLYPVGQITTAMIEALVKQLKAAHRRAQGASAKEEVRQALEEFLACRANPDRPGC
jgi:hypothetical protein